MGGCSGDSLQRFGMRVDAMASRVGDIDRRLARLEGWIEGERAGRTAAAEGAEAGA